MADLTAPESKASTRARMRSLRRSLDDREVRSMRLWHHLRAIPALQGSERLMIYTPIPGEPDTQTLLEWLHDREVATATPEDEPAPWWPDAVVVPGLAFTVRGDRLGQGGGWYDRFLAAVAGSGSGCTTIGVCFAEQIVGSLPIESHDVALDHVVTDRSVVR